MTNNELDAARVTAATAYVDVDELADGSFKDATRIDGAWR